MDTLDGFLTGDGEESPPPPLVRPVANPRLPADAGLSILGLLMHTAGTGLALISLSYTLAALIPGRVPVILALVGALSLVRSATHARAGRHLVDQGPAGSAALGTYAVVAGLHTAGCAVLALIYLPDPPLVLLLVGALALMSWPLLLLLLTRRGDARAAIAAGEEAGVRLAAEDRGLTALGILMAVGGVVMLAAWGAGLLLMLLSGVLKLGFVAVLGLVFCGLYGVRAWFGLRAGRVAAGSRDPRLFFEAFDRYNTLAIISVAVTALVVVIFCLFAGLAGLLGALVALPAVAAGLVWPRAIHNYARRLLPEVSFVDDPLPAIRRPRDAGLTGLGAVLLATALPMTLLSGVALIAYGTRLPPGIDLTELADPRGFVRGLVAFAAGWSLFRMTPRFRLAAVLYGVIASGLGLWAMVETLIEVTAIIDFAGPQALLVGVVQSIVVLTLPLATLWVALRHEEVGEDAVDADLAQAFD